MRSRGLSWFTLPIVFLSRIHDSDDVSNGHKNIAHCAYNGCSKK